MYLTYCMKASLGRYSNYIYMPEASFSLVSSFRLYMGVSAIGCVRQSSCWSMGTAYTKCRCRDRLIQVLFVGREEFLVRSWVRSWTLTTVVRWWEISRGINSLRSLSLLQLSGQSACLGYRWSLVRVLPEASFSLVSSFRLYIYIYMYLYFWYMDRFDNY